MARDYVLQGGDGVISVTANVAPKSVAKVPDCMLIARSCRGTQAAGHRHAPTLREPLAHSTRARQVMSAAKAGKRDVAELEDKPLAALHRDLFCEANPIPVKWSLHQMGR